MTTTVNNHFLTEACLFCNSRHINKVGLISYREPVTFSSIKIRLKHPSSLWKCKSCLSGFIQNSIPDDTLHTLYAEANSGGRWSNQPFETSKCPEVVDKLTLLFKTSPFVLDVGCNTGELLDYAKQLGCKTLGVELSKESQQTLKSKGHAAYDSLNGISDNSLDLITAFDLVEHLHDLNGFLESCKQKLKHQGKLVLLTGNINSLSSKLSANRWWYCNYPEHISFVSEKYLSTVSDFNLNEVIPTYASKGYHYSALRIAVTFLIKKLMRQYAGLPAISADHNLYILERV